MNFGGVIFTGERNRPRTARGQRAKLESSGPPGPPDQMTKGSNHQMINHKQPPRTARRKELTLLFSVFTVPTMKCTCHAPVGEKTVVDDDQWRSAAVSPRTWLVSARQGRFNKPPPPGRPQP